MALALSYSNIENENYANVVSDVFHVYISMARASILWGIFVFCWSAVPATPNFIC